MIRFFINRGLGSLVDVPVLKHGGRTGRDEVRRETLRPLLLVFFPQIWSGEDQYRDQRPE